MLTHKDDNGFLQAIGQCQGTLFKVCLMFTARGSEELRDLYQEIVCRLWQGWPSFDRRSSLVTWVYRVAFNTALSWQRSQQRRVPVVDLEEAAFVQLSQEAHDSAYLYELADRLTPDEKVLLRLYLDKVKLRKVAEILNTTEDAVKKRIQRMKQHLTQLYQEDQQ